MGMHASAGDSQTTPHIFFNHCGVLSWCDKRIDELDDSDIRAMRDFTESEAYLKGFRSRPESGNPHWNPFDAGFLFGEPHKLWNQYFERGQRDSANGLQWRADEIPDLGSDYEDAMLRSVIAMCDDLSVKFEASYAKFGAVEPSRFRILSHALRCWADLDNGVPEYDRETHHALAFSDHDAWLATFDRRGRYLDKSTGYWASLHGEFYDQETGRWLVEAAPGQNCFTSGGGAD